MEATQVNPDIEYTSVFKDDRYGFEDLDLVNIDSLEIRYPDSPDCPEYMREGLKEEWLISYCRFRGQQIFRYIDAQGVDQVRVSLVDNVEEVLDWDDDGEYYRR
jgi:hypothetical protein